MLVTFKTDSYANIVMFGDAAETLLKMLGQSGNVPGAIMADAVPQALADLQSALKMEEATKATDTSTANDTNPDDEDHANKIALATRAVPLIELLEAAVKSNDNVQWDQ
ncbi:MAG: DUF1840 domain-containing protein [Granulosicoccaceae bacterium]